MVLEIFIYLAIIFGVLILCITMFERDCCFDEKYIILKREKIKVKVIIDAKDLDEQEVKRIGWIIRKGKYEDIYDVVSDFELEYKR